MFWHHIQYAGVMELADVVDSKSTAGDSVPVRVRPPAPDLRSAIRNELSAAFLFYCSTIREISFVPC